MVDSLPIHLFPPGPCFAPLFGICDPVAAIVSALARAVPLSCCGQELGSSDFLLKGIELLLAQRAAQRRDLGDTPMQEARTEKGSSKYNRKAK